ncbi:hypothetical protein LTR85_000075 [Meristemomyces frigidus]|nr:hypothetical protein LTR85_000075 [Meristemomyces frigidus]
MAPPEPPTSITLKVKVPPGYVSNSNSSDEFALGSLPVSTSIGAIRQQIQQIIPSHPLPERQRLLYGGRALIDNEQTLADALNTKRDPTQTEYVVHLLVRQEGGVANAGTAAADGHRRGASVPSTPTPVAGQQAGHGGQGALTALQQHQLAHQQNVLRAMNMQQQQQLRAAGQIPLMPGQLPQGVQFPPGVVGAGMPGFGHAVAHGQQQRAAMGMHGLGGQPGAVPQQQENAEPVVNGAQFVDALRNATPQPPGGQQQQQGQQTLNTDPHAHAPTGNVPQNAGQQQPQQQRPPGRPISGQGFHLEGVGPNGQRFQIHQQTLNIPGVGIPGVGLPAGQNLFGALPHFPPGFPAPPHMPLPGFPPQPGQAPQAAGSSALDRAHENLAEMRRMLEEMRSANETTEENRRRIARLEERVREVGGYIDPFGMHGAALGSESVNADAGAGAGGRRSATFEGFDGAPGQAAQQGSSLFGGAAGGGGQGSSFERVGGGGQQNSVFNPPGAGQQGSLFNPPGPHQPSLFNPPGAPPPAFPSGAQLFGQPRGSLFGNPPPAINVQPPSNPNDVTCYLLSGPQGPQALLLSPQYGTYTGSLLANTATAATRTAPTPTPTTAQVAAAQAGQQVMNQLAQQGAGHDPAAAANGQARQQQADAAGANPLQPILNNMWLLLRVLVFAYFILGSNLGWRRPVALVLIGFGYWLIRMGLFQEGGVVRRWWEGIMRVGPQGQQAAPAGAAEAAQGPQAAAQGIRQAMPTPEQVAQRLVNQRNLQANARVDQVREFVRPVERAVALFVASLWPGIGEAAVRAREDEERRRRDEEEVAVRRREEEERVKREDEERLKAESEGQGEAKGGEGSEQEGGGTAVGGAVSGPVDGAARVNEEKAGEGASSEGM